MKLPSLKKKTVLIIRNRSRTRSYIYFFFFKEKQRIPEKNWYEEKIEVDKSKENQLVLIARMANWWPEELNSFNGSINRKYFYSFLLIEIRN